MQERPVWAEVNLSAIEANTRSIKSLLRENTRLCAVVKADAYGHGAVPVARAVLKAGADQLSVAILSEALELRQAGIKVPILILGYTMPEQMSLVVVNDLSQTVFTLEAARALSDAAIMAGTRAKVHLKIDTGMSRIGVFPEEAGDFAAAVAAMPNLEIEGVYTHFAMADHPDKSFSWQQFALFQQALAGIEAKGIYIPTRHCANSAGTLELPETHLDMVRAGIALYGLWPSEEMVRKLELVPAMRFKARVVHVKEVPSNTAVGYGCSYVTSRCSRIATLPVGYADGWSRMLSHKGGAYIRGQVAPLLGRVCMDQCMIDVTDIADVVPGDEVLLFGGSEQPVEAVAEKLGTINYELVCMIGKRVPRLYPQI